MEACRSSAQPSRRQLLNRGSRPAGESCQAEPEVGGLAGGSLSRHIATKRRGGHSESRAEEKRGQKLAAKVYSSFS